MATADCTAPTPNETEGATATNWDDDTATPAAAAATVDAAATADADCWGIFIIEMDCVESGSSTTETTSSLAHRAVCG